MPTHKQKVYCYITHGNRLLVFRHPDYPEAGIQVPGGTIEDGERPADAALREAFEETGLHGLTLARYLGTSERSLAGFGRDEIHQRWFYHLRYDGETRESWRHGELTPSEGAGPFVFEFFWAQLPDGVPTIIAGRGDMLPQLLEGWSFDV